MEPTDETLCQLIAGNDRGAFEQLVERHQAKAYRLAWSILRDPDDARDVSQEAFIRVFQGAASFDGRSRFSTWFHRILVNLCLDHQRKHRWWRRLTTRAGSDEESENELARIASQEPNPEQHIARRQEVGRVMQAVKKLSAKQRAALMMQVQEDMTTAEIASVLECSEATVRVHLHRALGELKRKLSEG